LERHDDALRSVHHEIIETRNLSIKADHTLRGLTNELKQLAKRLETAERRTAFNSIASYILFAVLSFAGLFMFFRAAIERNEVDHSLVQEQRVQIERKLADLEAELERRRQSERESYAFMELLQSGRRDEVVERFASVQGRLTDRATLELFRREVDRIRHEVGEESYREGIEAARDQSWERARDALLRSLSYVESAPYTPNLRYQLAESLYHLRDFAGAEPHYAAVISSGALARNDLIMAMFHRAESLERSSRAPDAAEAYRAFARRFEYHPWSPAALQRAASLDRRSKSSGAATPTTSP
jgi:tetratricopeptide (TPR) repeat protein